MFKYYLQRTCFACLLVFLNFFLIRVDFLYGFMSAKLFFMIQVIFVLDFQFSIWILKK